MFSCRATLITLLSVFVLMGSECTIKGTSGSSSRSDDDRYSGGGTIIVKSGRLVDAPVQGVRFVSGSLSGLTGPDGEFEYEADQSIRFFIGDIAIGEAVAGKEIISPLDLVPGGDIDTPAVITIARFLQSLDATPDEARITIPALVRAAAVNSNSEAFPSVQTMNFADEAVFVNTATRLIAVLTASYPFTVMLIDPVTAREHLVSSLAAEGIDIGAAVAP